jgi:hypothetical protein
MPRCAICIYLELPPRDATGTVGLMTAEPSLVDASLDTMGEVAGDTHVIVHACPEHVVDVYRGRIEGVRMAWRLCEDRPADEISRADRGLAAASSSRA